jgi:hypothetical protein
MRWSFGMGLGVTFGLRYRSQLVCDSVIYIQNVDFGYFKLVREEEQ